MITKICAHAATMVLTVGAQAACGSTSNVGQNSNQAAQANQICGQSARARSSRLSASRVRSAAMRAARARCGRGP